MLDDATGTLDLRAPAGNCFEKLHGHLTLYSIRVGKQWRLVFQWDGNRGEATGVFLDNHTYL